jgi:hypothetical protein
VTHKPQNSRYTILKVRLGRKSKDAWSLVRLLLVLFLGLATVGAVQVRICRSLHPNRGLLECLRPSPEAR